jgi:hypothetical protein
MMGMTFKNTKLEADMKLTEYHCQYYKSVSVYGDKYLKYCEKLRKNTNIDHLNWYSVVIHEKRDDGKMIPRRYVRYDLYLQNQLVSHKFSRKHLDKFSKYV